MWRRGDVVVERSGTLVMFGNVLLVGQPRTQRARTSRGAFNKGAIPHVSRYVSM